MPELRTPIVGERIAQLIFSELEPFVVEGYVQTVKSDIELTVA
jgi:hypothetical protein